MIERSTCYFKTRGERRATSAFVYATCNSSTSDDGHSQTSAQAVAFPSNIESRVCQRYQRGPNCSFMSSKHQAQALSHLHNSQLPTSRSSLRHFLQKALVVKELVF